MNERVCEKERVRHFRFHTQKIIFQTTVLLFIGDIIHLLLAINRFSAIAFPLRHQKVRTPVILAILLVNAVHKVMHTIDPKPFRNAYQQAPYS